MLSVVGSSSRRQYFSKKRDNGAGDIPHSRSGRSNIQIYRLQIRVFVGVDGGGRDETLVKILIASHRFFPDVGGIETVSEILARAFVDRGHKVTVCTQTLATDADVKETAVDKFQFPFEIARRPRAVEWLRLMRWCDIYWQSNISLQTLWPLLWVHRPWVVTHHTWFYPLDRSPSWQGRLKQWVSHFGHGIAIGEAVAAHVSAPAVVLSNPYRDDVFRPIPEVERDLDIIFVGRLVSDKGVDVLLEAIALLQRDRFETAAKLEPTVTIVGDGPEKFALEAQARQLGLQGQVTFAGWQSGEELARSLNRHHLIVVPSRWAEPFGLVALEGIACGCVAVGSEQGGLPEAIGACGITFPNGDATALATCLATLLGKPDSLASYRRHRAAHLRRFSRDLVADTYLSLFEETLCQSS